MKRKRRGFWPLAMIEREGKLMEKEEEEGEARRRDFHGAWWGAARVSLVARLEEEREEWGMSAMFIGLRGCSRRSIEPG